MPSRLLSRRSVMLGIAFLSAGPGVSTRVLGDPVDGAATPPDEANGLTRSSEAIHQEVTFDASRRRVYRALTNSKRFDAVTRLSDALQLVTAPGAKRTSISGVVGGPFTLFGGYITGRNLELIPGERLVQAWRTASWGPGDYSVVRFELVESGAKTRLIFDHRGFPADQGSHLASGWHTHYWEPLAKLLSQG